MKLRNSLSLLNADEKLRLRMIKGLIQRHNKALNKTQTGGLQTLSTELCSLIVQASTLTVNSLPNECL